MFFGGTKWLTAHAVFVTARRDQCASALKMQGFKATTGRSASYANASAAISRFSGFACSRAAHGCAALVQHKKKIYPMIRENAPLPHTALNNFYFVSCDTFFQPIIRCAGGFLCIRIMKRRHLLRDMRIPISSVSQAVLPGPTLSTLKRGSPEVDPSRSPDGHPP